MNKPSLKITLTAEQQAPIQQLTGRKPAVVELKPEALEARLAPGVRNN